MSNNSNPFDLDKSQVRKKATDEGDMVKATVLDVLPDLHAVRVNPRGGDTPFIAPVFTPMYGTSALPKAGERVTLIYVAENTPIALGAVYLEDGESPPDANPGDLVLGNGTGSHVTIHEEGHITIQTDGYEPVDIDHQSATAYMDSDYDLTTQNNYEVLPFDTTDPDSDPEDLLDASQNALVVRTDGLYRVQVTAEVNAAGQNNLYTVALFRNGNLLKRRHYQSAVNEPLTLVTNTQTRLDGDDVIDARVQKDTGDTRTVSSLTEATEFSIERKGI